MTRSALEVEVLFSGAALRFLDLELRSKKIELVGIFSIGGEWRLGRLSDCLGVGLVRR